MVILFYGLDGFLNFNLWNSSFIYSLKVLNFYHMQDSGLDDMGGHGHDIFLFQCMELLIDSLKIFNLYYT